MIASTLTLLSLSLPLLQGTPQPAGTDAPHQNNPAAQGGPPASAPAPIPLTPEQQAERIATRLQALATRVQALRTMAGVTNPETPKVEPPKADLPSLRAATTDLALEIQRRASGIETMLAGKGALKLLGMRSIPAGSFKPAPELKIEAKPITPNTIGGADVTGPTLPPSDPEKVAEQIFMVGGEPIFRGDLEKMVAARKKYLSTATDSNLAQLVLNQSLIPRAAVLGTTGEQIKPLFNRIKELMDQVLGGTKTFEELASKFSDDPSTKAFGGRLEVNPLILSDFERAALLDMKIGELSRPIATANGVEVLKLEGRNDDASNPKVTIRRILLSYQFGLPFDQAQMKIQEIIRNAKVKVLDKAYEPFLPPLVPREGAESKPADAAQSKPAEAAKGKPTDK